MKLCLFVLNGFLCSYTLYIDVLFGGCDVQLSEEQNKTCYHSYLLIMAV